MNINRKGTGSGGAEGGGQAGEGAHSNLDSLSEKELKNKFMNVHFREAKQHGCNTLIHNFDGCRSAITFTKDCFEL